MESDLLSSCNGGERAVPPGSGPHVQWEVMWWGTGKLELAVSSYLYLLSSL